MSQGERKIKEESSFFFVLILVTQVIYSRANTLQPKYQERPGSPPWVNREKTLRCTLSLSGIREEMGQRSGFQGTKKPQEHHRIRQRFAILDLSLQHSSATCHLRGTTDGHSARTGFTPVPYRVYTA